MSRFESEREQIKAALEAAGVEEVCFNKDEVPKKLPAAIVVLDGETGRNGTVRRFVDTDLAWSVYLIVNATRADDPDKDLYELKEDFRAEYQDSMYRDIPEIEYYTSRVDGARLVRVARLVLVPSPKGGGSA